MSKPPHVACAPAMVEDALQQAEAICSGKGGAFTPLRTRVLALLLESPKPTKAYDLLRKLRKSGQDKPPTVYRTLDFLQEMGLVHRIESLQAFVPCRHWSHEHAAIFLLCENCENAFELDSEDVQHELHQAAKSVAFEMKKAVIEVLGRCSACS